MCVPIQDWHQPASVLKLLLRCLYHILFTDTSTAAVPANTFAEAAVTAVPEEVLLRENENLRTLRTAGEVVQVLCAHIVR